MFICSKQVCVCVARSGCRLAPGVCGRAWWHLGEEVSFPVWPLARQERGWWTDNERGGVCQQRWSGFWWKNQWDTHEFTHTYKWSEVKSSIWQNSVGVHNLHICNPFYFHNVTKWNRIWNGNWMDEKVSLYNRGLKGMTFLWNNMHRWIIC